MKFILIFLALLGVITATVFMVKTSLQDTVPEYKIGLITTEEQFEGTISIPLSSSSLSTIIETTTTIVANDSTTLLAGCPDHLPNVLHSENIGCIFADIDDMTFQHFDEALKRCKYFINYKFLHFKLTCCFVYL